MYRKGQPNKFQGLKTYHMKNDWGSLSYPHYHIDAKRRYDSGIPNNIYGHYDPEASTIIKLMNDTKQRFSTRTNSRKVVYNRTNTNIRQNSFSIRIAKYWNKLPENIVNAPSINSLKNTLNKHWKDEEL